MEGVGGEGVAHGAAGSTAGVAPKTKSTGAQTLRQSARGRGQMGTFSTSCGGRRAVGTRWGACGNNCEIPLLLAQRE